MSTLGGIFGAIMTSKIVPLDQNPIPYIQLCQVYIKIHLITKIRNTVHTAGINSYSNVQTLYTTLWWYPKANTETRFESLSSIYPAVILTIYLAVLSIYPDIYLCHITWPYFQLCQAKHISGCATCPQLGINMLYSTTFWTENVTISPMSVWVLKKPPCHCWKMSLLA